MVLAAIYGMLSLYVRICMRTASASSMLGVEFCFARHIVIEFNFRRVKLEVKTSK